MADSPDWQRPAIGILTSLGYQSGGSSGTTVTYTLTANDRALVIQTNHGLSGTPWRIVVVPHGFAASDAVFDQDVAPFSTSVIFVNTAYTLDWDVTIYGPTGTSYQCLVASDSALPVVDIARVGQRTGDGSIPVVSSSDAQSLYGFGCVARAVAVSSGGTFPLTLYNASATAMRLRRLRIVQRAAATTAQYLTLAMVDITGAPTGGTAAAQWSNDAASTSVVTALALPTVSGAFVARGASPAVWMDSTLPGTPWEHTWPDGLIEPPQVETGHALGLRIDASGAVLGATANFEADWQEVP